MLIPASLAHGLAEPRHNSWVESAVSRNSRGVFAGVRRGSVTFRTYLSKKEPTSVLRAWFKYFDSNFSGLIERSDFVSSMEELKYPGNPMDMWAELDDSQTGVLSLSDLDQDAALLWMNFRKWCGSSFESAHQMLLSILGVASEKEEHERKSKKAVIFGRAVSALPANRRESTPLAVPLPQWITGLRASGWEGGHEETIFGALDYEDKGHISTSHLSWFDAEYRRFKMKQEVQQKLTQRQKMRSAYRCKRQNALVDFKSFIRKGFGPTYHAWRRVLDQDGSMSIQRAELFRACRTLGWRGDMRLLWQALDSDQCGVATLEELDLRCARILAQLKYWAEDTFGQKPVQAMWRAIDRRNRVRLPHDLFCKRCLALGFSLKDGNLRELARWLDWEGKKTVACEDLSFVDTWRAPAHLVALPDEEAANQLRKMMKDKYNHCLRAWRTVMDKDNSNTCNWTEFRLALKQLRFQGNAAGAWLALDHDCSGAISLAEVDPEANDILTSFRRWADEEFGGVRAAFKVLDKDKSGELSLREFRHAVQNFGYEGEAVLLFKSLDCSGQGQLHLHDVSFLDDWELAREKDADDEDSECDNEDAANVGRKFVSGTRGSNEQSSQMTSLYGYKTDGPGPGAYEVVSQFGAQSKNAPVVRRGPKWSFTRRPDCSWCGKLKPVGPTCTDFSPDRPSHQRRKPAWSFGCGRRTTRKPEVPGPGQYEPAEAPKEGKAFSIGMRRGGWLHPSMALLDGRGSPGG
eukprot:TRINITY_DN23590_c0_g1_i1.p1 TRINITY_DN23590_c0_g1~~TRINITY_DN23590_c0_g1_i1.p1  ORF type:complete len:746 (+),score=128.66 TRINITY_DN23590_c0_g1_i1:120-2357(+)